MVNSRGTVTQKNSSARILTLTAKVLLALIGAVTLAGGIYFTFFASPEQGGVATGADWAVAVWSLLMSIAYLVAAAVLSPARPKTIWFAIGVAAVHIVFGAVKFIGYQEYESAPFFIADLTIVVVLLLMLRRATR